MRVIFLDNDGVICLANNWGGRFKKRREHTEKFGALPDNEMPVQYRFDNFDRKAIEVLNSILEETGAEIVVSSDWRLHATLEELGEYYLAQGIIKKPIAVTERFKDIYPSEWSSLRFRAELELERSMEINHWIENHPEVTHWVAVDDLDMSARYGDISGNLSWGLTNFVLTPLSREGIKQSGVKDKILNFLR